MRKTPSQIRQLCVGFLVGAAAIVVLPFGSWRSADAQTGQFAQTGPTSEGFTAVAQNVQDPQYPRVSNLRWGFVDVSGNFITSPQFQFDQVQPFTGGFAGVAIYVQDPNVERSKNLKWGFINRAGKLITGHYHAQSAFPFDAVRAFSEGFAAVMNRYADNPNSPNALTEHWCFINTQGVPISPLACSPGYPQAEDFSGGKARVRTATGWGCIDKSAHFSLRCSPEKTRNTAPSGAPGNGSRADGRESVSADLVGTWSITMTTSGDEEDRNGTYEGALITFSKVAPGEYDFEYGPPYTDAQKNVYAGLLAGCFTVDKYVHIKNAEPHGYACSYTDKISNGELSIEINGGIMRGKASYYYAPGSYHMSFEWTGQRQRE